MKCVYVHDDGSPCVREVGHKGGHVPGLSAEDVELLKAHPREIDVLEHEIHELKERLDHVRVKLHVLREKERWADFFGGLGL